MIPALSLSLQSAAWMGRGGTRCPLNAKTEATITRDYRDGVLLQAGPLDRSRRWIDKVFMANMTDPEAMTKKPENRNTNICQCLMRHPAPK